uniref:Uncharacterized protein n=1 Tax=Oryza punctata TaxID=4537 RepID=A0A0E0KTT3_ORYPU
MGQAPRNGASPQPMYKEGCTQPMVSLDPLPPRQSPCMHGPLRTWKQEHESRRMQLLLLVAAGEISWAMPRGNGIPLWPRQAANHYSCYHLLIIIQLSLFLSRRRVRREEKCSKEIREPSDKPLMSRMYRFRRGVRRDLDRSAAGRATVPVAVVFAEADEPARRKRCLASVPECERATATAGVSPADDKVMGQIDARNMASDKQGTLIYTESMVSAKELTTDSSWRQPLLWRRRWRWRRPPPIASESAGSVNH